MSWQFDERYNEEARLADGTPVRLRLVRPHADGVVVTVQLPTAEAAALPPDAIEKSSPLYRLFALVASGAVALRRTLVLRWDRDAED